MDKQLDIDTFGAIIDKVLKDSEVAMLINLPEGSMEVRIKDNTRCGPVVQFYILLHALEAVLRNMAKDMNIDVTSDEWAKSLDGILGIVRADLTVKDNGQ